MARTRWPSWKTRIKKTKLSKEAREKADAELKKLKSHERRCAPRRRWCATISTGFWACRGATKSRVKKDLGAAQKVLDADHFGLEKVKERIVEYLAVQARSTKLKGPILCLVGPPGVGKTSLGAVGGQGHGARIHPHLAWRGARRIRDPRPPADLYRLDAGQDHPGLKKAKTTNPLILLDEIDKMGQDFRGDPASALLEVLDPEQNNTFVDHYLEVEYDLSNVMFITTANSYNMPGPLLDRMEIIPLAGYTEDEKREIARQHLLAQADRRPTG